LTEQPWTLLSIGLLLVAAAGVIFYQSRHPAAGWTFALLLVATAAAFAAERLIVTDREQIEATIYAAAHAVEADDRQAILALFAQSANPARAQAEARLDQFRVRDVKVTADPEIRFNRHAALPAATAVFRVRCELTHRRGGLAIGPIVPQLTVDFVKEGDQWRIAGFEENLDE
jgi:hypothetical protein